jgi:hypothetical protein
MTATMTVRAEAGADDGSRGPAALAPRVELHRIPDPGHARAAWLLVNRENRTCFALTDAEAAACENDVPEVGLHTPLDGELRAELIDAGFVASDVAATSRSRLMRCCGGVRRALTTLEVRTTRANEAAQLAYRFGARWMFHPAAVAAQIVIAVLGLVAMAHAILTVHTIALRVHPAQVLVVIAIGAASIIVHEMSHALVVVRGGGRIDAAGVRMHLGTPAFFVESIDAQLLTRRQRMLQAAAGPWAEWLLTSLAAIWLWTGGPSLIGPALLVRFVLLNGANVASNLLPFVKLDGSWLLADAVGVPDMSQQAEGAVARLVMASILRRPLSKRDRMFAAYSAANTVVAVALLAASACVWYELFAGVLTALISLGVFGWCALAALVVFLGRPALVAAVPRVVAGVDTVFELVTAIKFRAEFGWRIAVVQALVASEPTFAGLDDHQLSVLAGLLNKHDSAAQIEDLMVEHLHVPRRIRAA